jgi:uracil-DNA glycosylase family 4
VEALPFTYRRYTSFSRAFSGENSVPTPFEITKGDKQHFTTLQRQIVGCQRCSRLIRFCHEVARVKRRAYLDWDYWGKPVPSFGDPTARLLILGLAPGAHGANRTGRMFTGDRSGDFLYRSLFNAGFATQPASRRTDDGLELRDAWITASIHCAPPDNKPLPQELRNCRPYFERELHLLKNVRIVVVLGKIALDTYLSLLKSRGDIRRIADFRFGHNVLYSLQPALLCSYHPSQQNTSTGKLTQEMLDDIFLRAAKIIRSEPVRAEPLPSSKPTSP